MGSDKESVETVIGQAFRAGARVLSFDERIELDEKVVQGELADFLRLHVARLEVQGAASRELAARFRSPHRAAMEISWNEERDEVLAAIPSQVAVRGSIDRLVAARDHLVRVGLMPEQVDSIDRSLKHLYSQNSMEGAQHICWMHQALELLRDRPETGRSSPDQKVPLDPELEALLDAVVETDPRLLELKVLIDETKESMSYLYAGMQITDKDWDALSFASDALLRRLERKRRKRKARLRHLLGSAFRAMLLENSRTREAMKSDDWKPLQF